MKEVESQKSKVQRRVVQKFIRISGLERRLFLEALVLQLWVGLLLKVIPFRRIPELFENKERSSRLKVQGSRYTVQGTNNKEQETLLLLKTATQRASGISPWKNKCLVSSLAARYMLRRRNISSQISLGVTKGPGSIMTAHAWLKAGDFEVVEKRGDYQELYLF